MGNMPISYSPTLERTMPGIPRTMRGKDIILEDVEPDTSAGGTFKAEGIDLNPRLATSFPSANLSAQRYDMYEFTELRFRYHPTSAITTTPGIVFLAWEPNANRGVPADVKYINAFEYHSEGPVYSNTIELVVNKAHLPPPRYCRYLPTSSDLNLYDTGRLIVATDNCTLANVGYVEVYYTIKFYSYHLEDTLPTQSRVAEATISEAPGTGATATLSPTWAESFGNAVIGTDGSGGWILPAGKYLVRAMSNLLSDGAGSNETLYLQEDGSTVATATNHDKGINKQSNLSLMKLITSTGTEVFKLFAATTGPNVASNNTELVVEVQS